MNRSVSKIRHIQKSNIILETRMLKEQLVGLGPVGGYDWQKPKSIEGWKEHLDPHTVLMITGLVSLFIPVIGPWISAGAAGAEAKLYWDKGEKDKAVLSSLMMLLPFVPNIITKLPFLKDIKLGDLSRKILGGGKLNSEEIEILDKINKEKDYILQNLPKPKGKITDFSPTNSKGSIKNFFDDFFSTKRPPPLPPDAPPNMVWGPSQD